MILEKQRYRWQNKINIIELQQIQRIGYEESYHKRLMVDFLMAIPFEKLKEIVNFTEINPFNAGDGGDVETYQRLLEERCIEIKMEIYI